MRHLRRLAYAPLLATTLAAISAGSALAASPGNKKDGVNPDNSYPCQYTSMQPWDIGYGGFWSNSLAAYTDIEVTIYRRWDGAYDLWCDGVQTKAKFKVEPQQLSGICYTAGGVRSVVRQYRNGAYNQIAGPTVNDCNVWHSSGWVPAFPDASLGTFYGLAKWTSIDGSVATTPTHTQ